MSHCSICLEALNENNIRTICNHEFHRNCLRKWELKNSTCPLCRTLFNVNAVDSYGRTRLYYASSDGNLNTVLDLLKSGANVNVKDNRGYTALYIACQEGHLEIVKELLEQGAAVNAELYDGCTPLFSASQHGDFEIVKELLVRGAIDSIHNGNTSLSIACQNGHLEVFWILFKWKFSQFWGCCLRERR